MVKHQTIDLVTVREIVDRERYSITYIEKIFQSLRQANIVTSYPGKQGGFSLARPPSKITLREIVEALEGSTFDVFCKEEIRKNIVCTHFGMCGVRPVWKRTKELLDQLFASITLEVIAKEEPDVEHSFVLQRN